VSINTDLLPDERLGMRMQYCVGSSKWTTKDIFFTHSNEKTERMVTWNSKLIPILGGTPQARISGLRTNSKAQLEV
jgi:hypothetical protein